MDTRIDKIYKKFYKIKAAEKADKLLRHFSEYYEDLGLSDKSNFEVFISPELINEVVVGYFIDVIKYKESHFSCKRENCKICKEYDHTTCVHSKKINKSKIASFSLKWLLKIPVAHISSNNIDQSNRKDCKIILSANATCSLTYVTEILGIDCNHDEIYDDILYHLLYRQYDSRHFIIIFRLLEELHGKRQI